MPSGSGGSAAGRHWPSDPAGRALVAVPQYHKNAMAGAIKPRLHVGGSVAILPDVRPRRFLRTLAQFRIIKAGAVPTVFSKLLQHRDLIERLDFSALTARPIGSASVTSELMAEIRRLFGVRVTEGDRLTEGGPVMIGPRPPAGRRPSAVAAPPGPRAR